MKTNTSVSSIILLLILLFCGCAESDDFPVLRGDYLGQDPPGEFPEVFAPGIISLGFHEHHLTISPDGDEMFYVTSSIDHKQYAIIQVRRENNIWHKPEIASFSGTYLDMGPSYAPDGKTLFFTSKRPSVEGTAQSDNYDIWMVLRLGDDWSEPVNLGSPINSAKNEIFPSVAATGTIYFQSYKESGSESDFYYSRLQDGKYQEPQRLEFGISTEHYESHPAVSPDETYLIFQSIRPGGFGGVDFYISFRTGPNTWSQPVNLGEKVSSPGNVISPMVSPDGRYFFFARNDPAEPFFYAGDSYANLIRLYRTPGNGYGTLYWVDASFIQELKPESAQ